MTATRHEESLSKVPISVTALTQEGIDIRGIKDFQDVARFTPGVNIDNSGTNNISIRGIASTGGAGTTGIYIDDTPIQMRALAFNPDETLPKSFDLDRVEVLRGPQGTLFGAGSEGGTVRYITTQPSLTQDAASTAAAKSRITAGRRPQLRGRRRRRQADRRRHARRARQRLVPPRRRLDRPHRSGDARDRRQERQPRSRPCWCGSPACGRRPTSWTVTPSIYYQDRHRNDVANYWPLYSDPEQQPIRQRQSRRSARRPDSLLSAGAQDRGRLRRDHS